MTPVAPVALSAADDPTVFGGKAAQLAAAINAGLPVPGGFALGPDLVEAIAHHEAAACAALAEICARFPGPLAVRSSAIGEDGTGSSFAGQHATVLNVRGPDAVIAAIGEVWQSGRTEAAMAYRRRVGADMAVRVGVVVQRLVDADVAGVLFSRNPVTGEDELVVEASWGLGEAIVQGLVIPDRYRIGRAGNVIEATAGVKDMAVRLDPARRTREEPVAPEHVHRLCLGAPDLSALRDLVSRCDDVYGAGPHDIEWAIKGQTHYLLQRRPITTR